MWQSVKDVGQSNIVLGRVIGSLDKLKSERASAMISVTAIAAV